MQTIKNCPHCGERIAVDVVSTHSVTVDTVRAPNEPQMTPAERIAGMLQRRGAVGFTVRELQQRTSLKADEIADTLGAFLEAYKPDGSVDLAASLAITVKRGRCIYYVWRTVADAVDVKAFEA